MMFRYIGVGVFLTSMLFVAGCGSGKSGPERVAVSGTVQRSGQPLSNASISFLPKEGHKGPAATTSIEEGRYRFTKATGPVAGAHRAVIRINPAKSAMKQVIDGEEPGNQAVSRPGGPWEFDVDVPTEDSFEKDFTVD